MRFRMRAALLAIAVMAAACNGGRPAVFGPDYEYEEDLTLALDGSATLVVNASVPALAALHGVHLDSDPNSRADLLKEEARAAFTSPYSEVTSVSVWSRHGRRFVGVSLRVRDVRALPKAKPFAWSTYDLHEEGDQAIYRQTVTGKGTPEPGPGWKGDELIAMRRHLPARIRFHNSREYCTGEVSNVGRGKVLTWSRPCAIGSTANRSRGAAITGSA
jgi:hypothetical protein